MAVCLPLCANEHHYEGWMENSLRKLKSLECKGFNKTDKTNKNILSLFILGSPPPPKSGRFELAARHYNGDISDEEDLDEEDTQAK